MPDAAPRMDREKLARVVSTEHGFQAEAGDWRGPAFITRGGCESSCERVNAAASAWLDREIESIHKTVIQKLKKGGVGGLARLQVTFAFGEALCSEQDKGE